MQTLRKTDLDGTRSRILKAALTLFNEGSVSTVTTHDIAAKAGISPGNLYYHFRNKEEIVRNIFWEMEIFSKLTWAERGPLNPKESFIDFMRFFFGNLSKYRFFFRDFSLLLGNDAVLAKIWSERIEELFQIMRQAARLWAQAGILKPFADDAQVDAFIENCWVLANFSEVHLDARKKHSGSKTTPTELLVRYLYPYHTAVGQRALDLYLKA
jgi:AcrR family transcriptional regulator